MRGSRRRQRCDRCRARRRIVARLRKAGRRKREAFLCGPCVELRIARSIAVLRRRGADRIAAAELAGIATEEAREAFARESEIFELGPDVVRPLAPDIVLVLLKGDQEQARAAVRAFLRSRPVLACVCGNWRTGRFTAKGSTASGPFLRLELDRLPGASRAQR